MAQAVKEIPWLENVEFNNDTAIVKINPSVDDESVIHKFGSAKWKCLGLDPYAVEKTPDPAGLLLRITKRTIPTGGNSGYIFVSEELGTFDTTEFPQDEPADSNDETANSNGSGTEYSPQNPERKTSGSIKTADSDLMSNIDVSKL